MTNANDTIAAVASARGKAVRAVLRLSGARAVALLRGRFSAEIPPFGAVACRGRFSLAEAGSETDPLAEAFVEADAWIFRAPRSYTGEDVVELHLPGEPALTALVMRLLLGEGARVAAPGEFTRRAAEAGKMDLTRAEAVLAAIRARDDAELRRAQSALMGGLAREVAGLVDRLVLLLAPLELALDFSDQDVEIVAFDDHAALIAALAEDVGRLARPDRGGGGRTLRRVVLRGPANAGKSTLFNALLGRDAAIATPVRGTTRDVLTGTVAIDGVNVVLVDTAGDDVEESALDLAAGRARERALLEADLILEVRDGRAKENAAAGAARPSSSWADADASSFMAAGAPTLRVRTFSDLVPEAEASAGAVFVSGTTGAGIPELRAAIGAALRRSAGGDDAPFLVTERTAADAARAVGSLERAAVAIVTEPPEFAASDLRAALRALLAVSRPDPADPDPVLDLIFREFCIGK